jgi:RNA-directed DNA polymerase
MPAKKIQPATYKFFITLPSGIKEEIYSYSVKAGTKTPFSQITKTILSQTPAGQIVRNRSIAGRLMSGKVKSLYGITCEKFDGIDNYSIARLHQNNSWAYAARFADDVVLLCNTDLATQIAIKAAQNFLNPRGLQLNAEKTKIKDVSIRERFDFCGFEFAIRSYPNRYRIHVFPPKAKVVNIKNKIKNILNPNKQNLEATFVKLNITLRGWCNFYSSGNSKQIFSDLNFWLWHQIKDFFKTFYKKYPQFKRKSTRIYKRKLMHFIKQTHGGRYKTFSWWWCIPAKLTKAKKYPLWAYQPASTVVRTPSVVLKGPSQSNGLNAYHPEDALILMDKAMGWKTSLYKEVLNKTSGKCGVCGCDLLSEEFELHHITPRAFNGPNTKLNLIALCGPCHLEVTNAVKTKNIEKVKHFESLKVLSNVSPYIEAASN